LGGVVTVAVTLLGENDSRRVICDVTSLVTDESRVIDLIFRALWQTLLSLCFASLFGEVVVERDMIVIFDECDGKMVFDDTRDCCMAIFS
jgi:hypothetical protein